ncbi:23 kDa integral membrane protein [Drosophila willistoni]|uniref:Tetraspanin n=1 Tax=Drosophila willistoni TaxID=7260 RepID=B4MPV4_DROWI|nr:23 kDa integral membrane protein [Drosophila willistoni]
MDCGAVFVKYVLFIFNILFVICGILLITFGSIMVSTIKDFTSLDATFTANSVAIIILTLGCLIFVVAFLGCCGAIRENACFLTTYSVIMLVLLISQLILIIFVWVEHVQIGQSLEKIVETIWDQRKSSDGILLDTMQRTFKCCGLHNAADYLSLTVPASCCDSPTNGSCSAATAVFRPGCLSAVDDVWDTNANIIKYAGLGVTAIELVAFIFACCLANQTRNNARRQNY